MIVKMMNRLKKEEKGFTLIELLAVIVILAVIAAIAVPMILNIISSQKSKADAAMFHQVYEASRLYITAEKQGEMPSVVRFNTELQSKNYLEGNLAMPSSGKKISVGKVEYDPTSKQLTGVTLTTVDGTFYLAAEGVMASAGPIVPATTAYTTEIP